MSQALPKMLLTKAKYSIWRWYSARDLSLISPNQRMHTKFGILPVCVRARTRKMSARTNNLSSDVFFHVTFIVCFQLIKSHIQKRQFSQIRFIHRLLNLPLFSKIFHRKKKAFQLALEIKRKEIYWISSKSHMPYLASPKFSLKRSLFTRQ